jgi:hypothetical protein
MIRTGLPLFHAHNFSVFIAIFTILHKNISDIFPLFKFPSAYSLYIKKVAQGDDDELRCPNAHAIANSAAH